MPLHKRHIIKIITAIAFISCVYLLWHIRTVAVIKMDYIWPFHLVIIALGLIGVYGLKKDQAEIDDVIKIQVVGNNISKKIMRGALGALIGVTLLLLTMTPFISLALGGPKIMAEYGVKTEFQSEAELQFADFSLTYLGKRHVQSPRFKPGFIFHDFKVSKGDEVTAISWSSGAGDIAPLEFSVSGKSFCLEMGISDELGILKRNELVIWSQATK